MKGEEFIIEFKDNWLIKDHILCCIDRQKLEVLEDPTRKWWKILLQYISFNLYKAPYEYKVKIYRNDGKY